MVVPNSVAQVVAFVPWLVIDVGIVYTTWQYGPEQFANAPLIAHNMGWILLGGIVFMTSFFWAIIRTIGVDNSSFYIAYVVQILISSFSIAQLLARGNTSGHSWNIWYVGTFPPDPPPPSPSEGPWSKCQD